MYFKKLKFLKIFILLPIIYLFSLELILRLLIFIFTFNSSILVYGINNNITLTLHSLKKFELHISDNYKVFNLKNKNQLNNVDQIWIFGGSTSNFGFCDSKNISWVDLLEIDLNKKNFARNGVNSNFSINVLKSELQKNKPPKSIIWSNKFNEIMYTSKNPDPTDAFFYFTNSLKLTIKNKLITFYFFDEILLRLFDKLQVDLRYNKKKLKKSDYIIASENFFNNSKKAIELSKLYNVENFYIISLFNRNNLINSDNKFYEYYRSKVMDLLKLYPFVKFFDTKNYLNSEHKSRFNYNYRIGKAGNVIQKKDFYLKPLALFCDPVHQTYEGKVVTAKIISYLINGK